MEVVIKDVCGGYDPSCAFERASVECPQFVPGQSFKISDLLERFTRGQRLPGINIDQPNPNFVGAGVPDESLDDAPPMALDIVDVEALQYQNEALRKERQIAAQEAEQKVVQEVKMDVE